MSKLILLLAFFLHPQDKPPEKCAISGTVVDALTGQPLDKVDVWVDASGEDRFQPTATSPADAKGNFTIAGLEPGHYFLTGARNGYLDTDYGARRPGGGRVAIALEAGQQVRDVALKLFPYSVVAGSVHDSDGEPMNGVAVTAWAVEFKPGQKRYFDAGEGDTDDLGQFRISGLEPGRYYLRAELQTRAALVRSFYPGVPDPDAATLVEVGLGARVTGLEIALPRPRGFRVTVRFEAPAGLRTSCWLSSSREEYAALVRLVGPTSSSHDEFEFDKVPPGSYTVGADAMPADGASVSYSASQRLEVTDRDIGDFRLNLVASAAINAAYTIEGDRKAALKSVSLRFNAMGSGKFGEDQRLSTILGAGQYVVEVTGLPPGMYVKSMRSGTADVLREGLTVSGGGAIPLEIALSDAAGTLEGTLLDGADKPVPGATVVLIPEAALRQRSDRFYSVTTDQYGRYLLTGLAPGDYKVLAWDDVKPNSWFDPDFLRPLEAAASAVTVQPKGHDTLKLHLETPK